LARTDLSFAWTRIFLLQRFLPSSFSQPEDNVTSSSLSLKAHVATCHPDYMIFSIFESIDCHDSWCLV
jgi:hypothetical protein